MKAKVKNKKSPSVTPFPKLMISNGGNLVLFKAPSRGTLVSPSKTNNEEAGHTSDYWAMSGFKDFHGKVTLSNN